MPQFLARGLDRLADIFGITGSQVSTNQLDLSSVTLTADVARLAALGGQRGVGFGGMGIYTMVTSNDAAEVVDTSVAIYDPAVVRPPWVNPVPFECELWALDAFAFYTGASTAAMSFIAEATIFIVESTEASIAGTVPTQQFRRPLWHANTIDNTVNAGTGVAAPIGPSFVADFPQRIIRVPGTTGSALFTARVRTTDPAPDLVEVQAGVLVVALARGMTPW